MTSHHFVERGHVDGIHAHPWEDLLTADEDRLAPAPLPQLERGLFDYLLLAENARGRYGAVTARKMLTPEKVAPRPVGSIAPHAPR